MKRKTIFLIFVSLLFVGLLAACSSGNNNNNNGNNGANDPNNGNGNQAAEEPFELTIMANLHTPEVPSDRIEVALEEASGFDLTINWVPDGNYDERLNTALATQTLPQATFLKNQSSFVILKEAIRNNQFWELGPYLDQFENLSKLKPTILANTSVDGKIYSLYQGRPLSRQGVIYRKDWADNLGLPAPKTTDDLFEMAKQFTENDPDGNNQDDTFGFTDRNDLVYGAFKTIASYFGTPNGWGEQDGELLPEFMFDEYMDTMNYFKDLYDGGYINQEFPVTSKNDQQDFLKNGTAGIYVGSMGDVLTLYRDASELNPDIQFDVANAITKPGGEPGIWSIPGYGSAVLFSKRAVETEEELLKILEFFDFLMTPEGSNLLYHGFEGEHYEVEDGFAVNIAENDVRERDVRAYNAIEIGEPDTNGRYVGKFDYDVRIKAEELILDNESHLINDPTAPLDSQEFNDNGTALQQIIDDATYQYIIGNIDADGFQSEIDRWLGEGGQTMIDEFNASWADAQ